MINRTSKARSKSKVDINIQEAVISVENKLKQFALDLDYSDKLRPIFKKRKDLLTLKNISIEVILLFDELTSTHLRPLEQWLGLSEKISKKTIQQVKENKDTFDFWIYTYENRPVRKISNIKPTIKIIVYDENVANREELDYEFKELSIDTPCCFLVSLKDNDKEINTNKLKLYAGTLYVKAFEKEALEEKGFISYITNDAFRTKLKLSDLFNKVSDFSLAGKLLEQGLQEKKQSLMNNSVLNEKTLLKQKQKETDVTSKDAANIKSDLAKSYRSVLKIIEEQKEGLEQKGEKSFIEEMQQYIEKQDKFVEEEKGKNTILKIPNGVLKRTVTIVEEKLTSDFNAAIDEIKEKLKLIELEIRQHFNRLELEIPVLPSRPLTKILTEKVLNQQLLLEKQYERSMTKKGFGHLFSELRTPLFMIMPLMMIVGILGSFFTSEDRGVISDDHQYNDRNAVIIEELPDEYKEGGYEDFVEFLYHPRRQEKFKQAKDNLLHLNEIVESKTIIQYGKKKVKKTKTLDYYIDKEAERLVLYLHPDGQRSFVVEVLNDPTNKMMLIKDDSKGGGGMGALYGLGNFFGEYKLAAFCGFILLIGWFVQSKLGEFKLELDHSMEQNKNALTKDLRSETEKIIRKSTSVWSSKIAEHVKRQEEMQQEIIYNALTKVVDENREKLQDQLSLVQRRDGFFKEEERKLKELNKSLHKQLEELSKIKNNFRKLMQV